MTWKKQLYNAGYRFCRLLWFGDENLPPELTPSFAEFWRVLWQEGILYAISEFCLSVSVAHRRNLAFFDRFFHPADPKCFAEEPLGFYHADAPERDVPKKQTVKKQPKMTLEKHSTTLTEEERDAYFDENPTAPFISDEAAAQIINARQNIGNAKQI